MKKKLKVISKANKGLIIVGHEIIIRKLLLEKLKIFEIENKIKILKNSSISQYNKNYISSKIFKQ